jgi:serine/threonine protein kinase
MGTFSEGSVAYGLGYKFPLRRSGLLRPIEYVVTATIGKGGFGEVFECKRELGFGLTSTVALKALHPASSLKAQARFAQECEVVANLEHPNIVRILAVLDEPFGTGLVQEYIAGARRLHEYFRDNDGQRPEARLSAALQVLYALRQAHRAEIIHRDITPANVLVDSSGRVKVIDFGLAKRMLVTGAGLTVGPLGTPRFRAPEQERPDLVTDHRADIYGLGGTLNAASDPGFSLPDSTPSTRESWEDGGAHVPPPPIFWAAVLSKMTKLDPDQRYASAEETASALVDAGLASGVVPDDLLYHLREMSAWDPECSAFSSLAKAALRQPIWQHEHLEILALLGPKASVATGQVRAVVHKAWTDIVETTFPTKGPRRHNYSEVDGLNEFIAAWFHAMDEEWQDFVFARLTAIALRYNRYASMDLLRALFGAANATRQARFRALKVANDPTGYIVGIG